MRVEYIKTVKTYPEHFRLHDYYCDYGLRELNDMLKDIKEEHVTPEVQELFNIIQRYRGFDLERMHKNGELDFNTVFDEVITEYEAVLSLTQEEFRESFNYERFYKTLYEQSFDSSTTEGTNCKMFYMRNFYDDFLQHEQGVLNRYTKLLVDGYPNITVVGNAVKYDSYHRRIFLTDFDYSAETFDNLVMASDYLQTLLELGYIEKVSKGKRFKETGSILGGDYAFTDKGDDYYARLTNAKFHA